MNRGLILLVALLACTSCRSRSKAPPKFEGYKIHAVNADFEFGHEVIPLDEIELPEIYRVIPGGILNNPPLILADVKGLPAMGEMFGPLGWSATTKFSGQGILKKLKNDEGEPRAHTLVLRLVLDYAEVEMLKLDYPQLGAGMIANMPRTEKGHFRFTPVTVRLMIYPSDDHTAIRIVLDSVTVYEGAEAIKRRGDSTENPLPVLTTVTYHYPEPEEGTIRFVTVIFDHKYQATNGIFVGHRQFSPWIPLQKNADTAPFDLRIRVTEVTSRPWLEKFSDDISKLISPVMRSYRGVR